MRAAEVAGVHDQLPTHQQGQLLCNDTTNEPGAARLHWMHWNDEDLYAHRNHREDGSFVCMRHFGCCTKYEKALPRELSYEPLQASEMLHTNCARLGFTGMRGKRAYQLQPIRAQDSRASSMQPSAKTR